MRIGTPNIKENRFDITLHDAISLRRTSDMLNVAAKQIKDIHREVKIVIIIAIREAEMISLFEIDVKWAYPNQSIEKSRGRLENKAALPLINLRYLLSDVGNLFTS